MMNFIYDVLIFYAGFMSAIFIMALVNHQDEGFIEEGEYYAKQSNHRLS